MHVHSFVPKPPLAVQNSTQIFHTANNEHCGGLETSLECLKFEGILCTVSLEPRLSIPDFGLQLWRNCETKSRMESLGLRLMHRCMYKLTPLCTNVSSTTSLIPRPLCFWGLGMRPCGATSSADDSSLANSSSSGITCSSWTTKQAHSYVAFQEIILKIWSARMYVQMRMAIE